ncbi:hypothetical protein TNCV_3061111 [Trichonephila clavipes]|nr:hypothetical protein TNCV_3061111 [Trichonephila clavipes]
MVSTSSNTGFTALMEQLTYTFKIARYFTHTCSTFGDSRNKMFISVKWSHINKILQMSHEKKLRLYKLRDGVSEGAGSPHQSITPKEWHSGKCRKILGSGIRQSGNCALHIRNLALPLLFLRPYM